MIEFLVFCGGSLVVFMMFFALQQRFNYPILNPLLLIVATIVSGLLWLGIDYDTYISGAGSVNLLLEPAVVLLGYPLYRQMSLLRKQWCAILLICGVASLLALTISAGLACLIGLEPWLVKSIVTLNITTPVSMSTAAEMGGSESIAAVVPLIAGLTGSMLGVIWLAWLGLIKRQLVNCHQGDDNAAAQKIIGMGVGSVSHAVGTASISKTYPLASAYSSSALIMCAMLTAIIAPVYIPWIISLLT